MSLGEAAGLRIVLRRVSFRRTGAGSRVRAKEVAVSLGVMLAALLAAG